VSEVNLDRYCESNKEKKPNAIGAIHLDSHRYTTHADLEGKKSIKTSFTSTKRNCP
jgi:hypothetical protein